MKDISILGFSPVISKENGLFIIDIDKVEVPFGIKEKSIVSIPPMDMGGEHRHPRLEAFISLSPRLEMVWKDAEGYTCRRMMSSEKETFLFVAYPNTPHAILNHSRICPGILLEFADGPLTDMESVKLIESI